MESHYMALSGVKLVKNCGMQIDVTNVCERLCNGQLVQWAI